MIKMICADLDNTLLVHGKNGETKKRPGLAELERKLEEKGVLLALMSGRALTDQYRLFPEGRDRWVYCGFDGALCTFKGEVLISRPLEENLLRAFFDGFSKISMTGSALIFYGKEDCYLTGAREEARKKLEADGTLEGHVISVGDVREIREPVYRISVLAPKETDFDYLKADWAHYLRCVFAGGGWCEFVSADTDKSTALALLRERFFLRKEEILAFGDGCNDFTLLENAGISYAIAGSAADREEIADFVTEDPVRTALELIGAENPAKE